LDATRVSRVMAARVCALARSKRHAPQEKIGTIEQDFGPRRQAGCARNELQTCAQLGSVYTARRGCRVVPSLDSRVTSRWAPNPIVPDDPERHRQLLASPIARANVLMIAVYFGKILEILEKIFEKKLHARARFGCAFGFRCALMARQYCFRV
jgi:hypothetical protein